MKGRSPFRLRDVIVVFVTRAFNIPVPTAGGVCITGRGATRLWTHGGTRPFLRVCRSIPTLRALIFMVDKGRPFSSRSTHCERRLVPKCVKLKFTPGVYHAGKDEACKKDYIAVAHDSVMSDFLTLSADLNINAK